MCLFPSCGCKPCSQIRMPGLRGSEWGSDFSPDWSLHARMALQSPALKFLLALASLLSAHGQEELFNIQIVPRGTGKRWFFLLEASAVFPPVSWIFILGACSPGLEATRTPEGCVSWGSLCLPQGQELQCSVHWGSEGETGPGWMGSDGSCPLENQCANHSLGTVGMKRASVHPL